MAASRNIFAKTARQILQRLKDRRLCDAERAALHRVYWVLNHTLNFVQITIREFLDDKLLLRAMALTFATLLSTIPLLALTFSMFKLFGGGDWFMDVLRPLLTSNLAPGASPAVIDRLESLLEASSGPAASGIGLIFLLIMVYSIFTSIEGTFNVIWGATSRVGPLRRLSIYWGLITIIPLLMVSSLAFSTYIMTLPMVSAAVLRVNLAQAMANRLIPGLMVMAGFFLLYRFLPNARVKSYAALIGAVVAGLLYESLKSIFIIYTSKLVRYDVIYGSVAALPLLMIWINLSWVVVLLGVEIAYAVQYYQQLLHKRKRLLLSRAQRDALSYMVLAQVTLAFRGQRPMVTVEEFSRQGGAPPNIVRSVISRLQQGGIVAVSGSQENELLLKKSPDYLTVDEIDKILTGEALEEWIWPDEPGWLWMKEWLAIRNNGRVGVQEKMTLDELVGKISGHGEAQAGRSARGLT